MALATLAGSTLAFGQTTQPGATIDKAATAAPAPTPAGAPNTITTIAVSGKVGFKADADASLAELKVGQALNEMAEVLTGPNAIAQIKVGDGQVFTIDHNSRVLIKDAVKAPGAAGKQGTTLQIPYGRVRFDVTSTKVANDVKIQTPDATLAVKGTHGVIEKLPGQPTRAYGGELNAGVFNVMYTSGIKVDVTKNRQTSGDTPQTAATADKRTAVGSKTAAKGDKTSRSGAGWTPVDGVLEEGDERALDGQNVRLFLPRRAGLNPLAGDVTVGVDPDLGAVITITGPNGVTSIAGSGITGFLGTVQGAALVNTEFGPYLLAIDSNAGPNYRNGTLALRFWNPGDRTWTMLGSLSPLKVWVTDGSESGGGHFVESGYTIDGLGNLSGSLYASGINPLASADPRQSTGNWGIFELTPPAQQRGEASARQVMSFPMLQAGGGLTGANSRGTMFAAARFNQLDGSSGVVLLEIDPRINYVVNAWSAVEGDVVRTGANGPALPGGFQATGVSFANGSVVMTGTANGRNAAVTIKPTNDNHPTARVTSSRVDLPGRAGRDTAGEGGFNRSVPFALRPADRQLPRLTGVDPLWLATSYSRTAAGSRTFRRMVADTVFARTPSARRFESTAEFNLALSNALADHYNQQDGVNSALSEFYNSIVFHNGTVAGVSALPVGNGSARP
ncbi:MAG: FecR family protein [Phycisphaerales bacterium]|nr:FecR family protein [Phycisphaerales bacterium]